MKDRVVGIITANYDTPELNALTGDRTVASLPYAGRYRLIDFALSNMVNSGIGTVGLITPYKYRSIIDHIGAGSEWALDRKNGGLFVLPGSVFGITSPGSRFLLRDIRRNLVFLTRSPAPYVLITSSNTVFNMDYNPLIEQHVASGADITMVTVDAVRDDKDVYSVKVEGGRVVGTSRGIKVGDKAFIDCFILSHSLLLKILEWYSAIDYLDFFEVLEGEYEKMDVRTYEYDGYARSIFTVDRYFERSMDLLNHEVFNQIFNAKRPIITKITDMPPTNYADTAHVRNSIIPAGCVIKGEVEDSILFRGVTVGKGAIVRNSIIMQACEIQDGAIIENAIIDRSNVITAGTVIKGSTENIYIKEKNELGRG